MKTLREQLVEAEAQVASLRQRIGAATCAEAGHDWHSIGGANCGCADGLCSVPVHECRRCGDCDYGENADADKVRRDCTSFSAWQRSDEEDAGDVHG